MNISDVTKLPVAPHMPRNVKQLRENAPRYIKSIIEQTYAIREVKSLRELGQGSLTPLGGGMLSAAYWLQVGGESRVIKLRYRGIDAEAKSLEAWQKKGADVVGVIAKGVVPETKHSQDHIKYLVLEGVTDKKGEVAPTCFEYVQTHPEATRKIGEILGRELFKIHQAKTTRSFGEFADMWGKNKSPLKTWNTYLQSFVIMQYDYLLTLGLTESKLKRLLQQVKEKKFPKRGTFVHGDYSLRNAMLTS
jgi:fructosamine-3-kinase